MDQVQGSGSLIEIVKACALATEPAVLVDEVLPLVQRYTGAAAIALEPAGGDPEGDPVQAEHVQSWQLPGLTGTLRLGWPAPLDAVAQAAVDTALDLVTLATGRLVAEHELADLQQRVDSAQHLAGMGDYDWHIATDTNRWSDELFRIYGYEPQSFNASYERFLANIHAEDRERIQGIHEQAYATGEPYSMVERIVRPDGELRYLSSNGEVILDETGSPVRMRGTCIDITDRVLAERAREQVTERFQHLVDAAPQAILVVDESEHVVHANPHAVDILGADLGARDVRDFLPRGIADGQALTAFGRDGRGMLLDVVTVGFHGSDERPLTAMFLTDAHPRLDREAMATRLGEVHQRRRQALEINDNVVQGLTSARYALDQEDGAAARSYLDRTLVAARHMMDDLLEPQGQDLRPGDLVRAQAASLEPEVPVVVAAPAATDPTHAAPRILIVDDAEDIRMLLRMKLGTQGPYEIVGEAVDGIDAVDQARQLQPNLVLLDMAMPRMDGLQALPLIREAVPDVRVIVLSGFNQATLEQEALAAGADRYVVKGGSLRDLLDVIANVLQAA